MNGRGKRMLLKAGQTCVRIWFVEYGLLRRFYIDGVMEETGCLQENDFVVSVPSLFQQVPSTENIEVLEGQASGQSPSGSYRNARKVPRAQ